MTAPDMLGAALDAYAAGLCVLSAREDGSKAPIAEPLVDARGEPILGTDGRQRWGWDRWQRERSTEDEIRRWYAAERKTGLGYVCGAVSGNLELYEFDCRRTYEAFKATADQLGMGELIARIEGGYAVETPGGGVHWLIRCGGIAGNTKLAQRPKRPDEKQHPRDNVQVLIETRGEGGYTIEAPTYGRVHPSCGTYRLVSGGTDTIVTVTATERRSVRTLMQTFDEMPESQPNAAREDVPFEPVSGESGLAVIDDYNARTEWSDLLVPDGWVLAHERGVRYWRRPGKDRGWSAISGYSADDRFCCYSTSTDLEAQRGYSKFAYYAHRSHGDDFKAAVRDLSRQGYGKAPGSHPGNPSGFTPRVVAPTPWPEPARVLGLPPAPVLDLSLFPPEIANVALDASDRLQCPPDYVAMSAAVSMAALIGRGVGIRPRQHDDWTEMVALWVALIGPPSWMKTPALQAGLRPLRRQEAIDRERYEQEHADWEAECDEIKAQATRGRKPQLPPEPVERRWSTSDATIEKLAVLLADNPGLAMTRDELAGWVGQLNKYGRGEGDRQFYLEAYPGGPYTVDRIGRGTLYVRDIGMNIIGGAQPERALDMFGTGPDDGFAARVTAIYPEMPAEYREVDRWPDKAARNALDAVSDRLVAANWSSVLLVDDWKPLPFCRLAPDAGQYWSEWHTGLMAQLRAGAWEGRHAGRVGKYAGLAARLALVWHLVEWGAGRVADDKVALVPELTMAKVLDLMTRYIAPMDARVYRAFDRSQAANGGERIARWIIEQRPASFTLREIRRHGWSGLTEPDAVEAATEWLAAMGWVREADPEQRPGRPSSRFDVNPRAWEAEHVAAA